MDNQTLKKVKLKIHGMHCQSCEVFLERKFKEAAGVKKANVSHTSGRAEILCSKEPNLNELNNLVKQNGYYVSLWQNRNNAEHIDVHKNTAKDYLSMGGFFLVIVSLYYILKQFNLVPSLAISEHMSYGFVFLIGLFAAVSTCIAVVGGLLLAVAGKYNELHPGLAGIQKFKPHIYFNAGRIAGYTAFGAAVGSIGSVLTLSAKANGYLIILVSLVMLALGFQLLHLFPFLRRFSPKMPKLISHKIHDLSKKGSKGTSFILGALTFFLPCGFTQALQLYVLASGDWKVGALTMLAFSLGTLPALISLSAISSFAKGEFQKHFLKFAGVFVVLLALFNINNGLTLSGYNFNLASFVSAFTLGSNSSNSQPSTVTAEIVDGKQIVDMQVVGLDYYPHQFTVVQGIPVEWRIDGSRAQGCAQVISVPKLDIVKYLSPNGFTVINFTPQEAGSITFSCTMGMTTRGSAFMVVPNTTGAIGAKTEGQSNKTDLTCDPKITDCVPSQQISLGISQERGIYPSSLTVKKGIPVDLTVNNQVQLGGCMSVWVIPEYNVTIPMKVGTAKTAFMPTKTGTFPITCSMGAKMAEINVID